MYIVASSVAAISIFATYVEFYPYFYSCTVVSFPRSHSLSLSMILSICLFQSQYICLNHYVIETKIHVIVNAIQLHKFCIAINMFQCLYTVRFKSLRFCWSMADITTAFLCNVSTLHLPLIFQVVHTHEYLPIIHSTSTSSSSVQTTLPSWGISSLYFIRQRAAIFLLEFLSQGSDVVTLTWKKVEKEWDH